MNLAEAIAHIAAMAPDEKAAWDQANGFAPEAVRDYRASQAVYGMADAIAPRPPATDDIDALVTARNNAMNLTLEASTAMRHLRIWPGDYDSNFPRYSGALDPA